MSKRIGHRSTEIHGHHRKYYTRHQHGFQPKTIYHELKQNGHSSGSSYNTRNDLECQNKKDNNFDIIGFRSVRGNSKGINNSGYYSHDYDYGNTNYGRDDNNRRNLRKFSRIQPTPPNDALFSPDPPNMDRVIHVSNYYGLPEVPGGSRCTISSPTGYAHPQMSCDGSSINYIPSTREQTRPGLNVNVIKARRRSPPENSPPSRSNDTVDYDDDWLRKLSQGNRGYSRTDHFPRAGRSSPDSMAYIHQGQNRKDRAPNRSHQNEPPSKACCVVS